jgi:hypothetical protein
MPRIPSQAVLFTTLLALAGCAQVYPSPEEEQTHMVQALRAWYRGPMIDSCAALPGPESRHGCVLVIKRALAKLRGDAFTHADHYDVELAKAKGADEVLQLSTRAEREAWLRGPRTRACQQGPSPTAIRQCLDGIEGDLDRLAGLDDLSGDSPEIRAERAVARIEAKERERAIDRQREHERGMVQDQAAGQALLGLGVGGGLLKHTAPPAPIYQPQPATVPLYHAPVSRPPVNCTSNTVGAYDYTNCD